MALPIAATPTLNAKASKKFYKQIERDLKHPVGPVPTPKIKDAIRLIKTAARNAKK